MRAIDPSMMRMARAALLALVLAIPVACAEDATTVATEEEGIPVTPKPAEPVSGGESYYTLATAGAEMTVSSIVTEATSGLRWCHPIRYWIDPAVQRCGRYRTQPPYGTVVLEAEGLRVGAGNTFPAPFLWTAGPERTDPFPAEEDFVLDVEIAFEQLGLKELGLQVSRWMPARTDGSYDPATAAPVLRISGQESGGLVAVLLNRAAISISDPLASHAYQLVYRGGAYSLFIDGTLVDGPVASDRRPNAFWIGSPHVTWYWGDWSDLLLTNMEVSVIDPVLDVPFEIKPGGCPSPLNRNSRGVLPAAVNGTADLDVTKIDPATIRLGGVAPLRYAHEDVGTPVEPFVGKTVSDCSSEGPDGVQDLTLKFDNQSIAALLGDANPGDAVTLPLTGELFDGTAIRGEDVVIVR